MTYNLKRHIELLKCSEELWEQQRKFSIESREEYFELLNYNGTVEE